MGLYSPYGSGTTSCPSSLPTSASVTSSGITVETLNRNTLSVSWTAPSDYCGPRRTFRVEVTPQGSNNALCSVTTSQNFMNCTGIQSSQSYTISVITMITCRNGDSVLSAPSTATYRHPCYISDAPNNVVFTRTSGVVLNWDGVTNCGSVNYNVYWSCGNSGEMVATNDTSFRLDVTGQTSFTYCLGQVQACNEQGCGSFSDNMAVQVPLQSPPAVYITGAVNGTTVLIMFIIVEPTDLNDLNYTLYRQQTHPNSTMSVPIFDNLSYNFSNVLTDSGPSANETYQYQMVLHNSIGNGPPSNNLSVTTTQVRF